MASNSACVRFLLNGDAVEVAAPDPHLTLLEWLREERRLTGSKEGCAEGDCGACTVVLGERSRDAGGRDRVALAPINACLRLLPTLDGKAVFTVEGLRAVGGALHPTQQALVDRHASQCGFCTPGFVMALFALFKTSPTPSRDEACVALAGNLCRCTGYRPILDAAQTMYQYDGAGAQSEHERWLFTPATADAPPLPGESELAARLAALARDDALAYEKADAAFIAPRSVAELASAVLATPEAWILGGGTDVGLWITKALQRNRRIIYTGEVAALREVSDDGATLRIGAAVPLEEAFRALNRHYPELASVWTRFASVPIRSSGTLGGNVANGSPIGDSMPALIALGAAVVLRRGEHTRALPLEALYLDYRKQAREPGEWIEAIVVPIRADASTRRVAAYKNARRNEQDISAVFLAIALDLHAGRIDGARVACGGMAGVPKRATHVERALNGADWNEATIRSAMRAMADDFTPLDDLRASAEHRLRVARNLLLRFWHEQDDRNVEARVF